MKNDISREKNIKNKLKKAGMSIIARILSFAAFATGAIFWLMNFLSMELVFASGNLKSSQFYKGTEKLLKDLSAAILVIAPIVTVIVVMYCFVRKGAADEMDYKKWQTRITTAVICGIGAVTAAALLNMFAAYYGATGF